MPLGIYHNPDIWFVPQTSAIPSKDYLLFDKPIAEKKIDTIAIAVYRDGLFTFDFSEWPNDAEDIAKRSAKQVEIMNTYLLCLYGAIATRGLWRNDSRQQIPIMRVDHSNIFAADDKSFASTNLSSDLLHIVTRRKDISALGFGLGGWNVSEQGIGIAFEVFSRLWQEADDRKFTFADLLLGAHVAHFNLRFAESLGIAWLISETLLDEMWRKYLERNRRRNGQKFITANEKNNRLKRLTSSDFSASVKIETLSLLD